MQGFRRFGSAALVTGIELAHKVRNSQFHIRGLVM
jgi:hypothetical protein